MKKIISILTLHCYTFVLMGCAYVSVKKQDPMELWGVQGKTFEGRVFSARSWHRPSAIKKIARLAKRNGFKYFTILQDRQDFSGVYSSSSGKATARVSSFTNSVEVEGNNSSYSMPSYTFTVLALFLYDDELQNWKNIYSVDTYTK